MNRVTLSVIKADVGSIGGHTKPSHSMLEAVQSRLRNATGKLLIDGLVTYTGDDIAMIMSHRRGASAEEIHRFAWDCFLLATEAASRQGLRGRARPVGERTFWQCPWSRTGCGRDRICPRSQQ